MFKSVLAGATVASATAAPLFASYDLTEAQVAQLTAEGCYRGVYGDTHEGQAPRLHLSTCAPFARAQPIAELGNDDFMCVVELSDAQHMDQVSRMIKETDDSEILLAGDTELVVRGTKFSDVRPSACCPLDYDGMVDNTPYVPKAAIKKQIKQDMSHPAAIRGMQLAYARKLRAEGVSQPLPALAPNPEIAAALNDYNRTSIEDTVVWLSTGYSGNNEKITRNSYAIGEGRNLGGCIDNTWRCSYGIVNEMEERIRGYFASYPGEWRVFQEGFRDDMCNNLILEIPGRVDDWVVTGAHMDARNTNSGRGQTGISPGADDNGTGTAHQMEMARVISGRNMQFEHGVRILWFCGEEQGLLGSRALAQQYSARGDKILGMFNADMIGYTDSRYGVTVAFMNRSRDRELTEIAKELSQLYLPDLKVGETSGCCSDQQSFFEQGFPAVGIFETPTASVVYPQYHRAGDTFDNGLINYDQVYQFGQSIMVSILEYGVPLTSQDVEEVASAF